MGVSDDRADSMVLVLDEIVTNAIEHGDSYRNSKGWLLLRIEASGRDLLLEFEDPDVPPRVVAQLASAIAAWTDALPPVDSERGRGLFLIARNLDRPEIKPAPGGGLQLRGRFRDVLA